MPVCQYASVPVCQCANSFRLLLPPSALKQYDVPTWGLLPAICYPLPAKKTRKMNEQFLKDSIRLFKYYKHLGEGAMDQVNDEQLFVSPDSASNSMAVMVKHLWGNMLSRWTDFLTTDGEKDFRKRDEEFVSDQQTRAELYARWEEGWACLFDTLESLSPDDMSKTVYIRNQGHAVSEAIQRQIAHYSYHVGQLVFLAKQMQGDNWNSLSIPKNQSSAFNEKHFDSPKGPRHFTDDFLEKNS